MRKYNINANLVRVIEHLYGNAIHAVQMNGSTVDWFRRTVGFRQGCLLSPTSFNIFLERIISDAVEENDEKVSLGGRIFGLPTTLMLLLKNSRMPQTKVSTRSANGLKWR